MAARLWTATLALASLVLTTTTADAQDQATFLIRLGNDTVSAERVVLTGGKLEIDQATRFPRAMRRHAVVTMGADGAVTAADVTITRAGAPAGSPPVQHSVATFTRDSVHLEVHVDTVRRKVAAAVPAGAGIPVVSPWAMYDMLSVRLAASGNDSLHIPMYYLGSQDLSWVAVRKLDRDSVEIQTEFDRYRARVDRNGRLLGIRPLGGTQQFAVERAAALNMDAYAADFAAREMQAGAMGQLSPRDTATAEVAGAHLWVDYGRPSRRGRAIFGGVVHWGEVWRTGANAATQFRTDKPLVFGNVVVPAGMYTLWTIPAEQGWTLLVNSQTGQWGTEHNPDRDVYRIPMSVAHNDTLAERFTIHIAPGDKGGQIHFVWDRTVAAVDFTVQQ